MSAFIVTPSPRDGRIERNEHEYARSKLSAVDGGFDRDKRVRAGTAAKAAMSAPSIDWRLPPRVSFRTVALMFRLQEAYDSGSAEGRHWLDEASFALEWLVVADWLLSCVERGEVPSYQTQEAALPDLNNVASGIWHRTQGEYCALHREVEEAAAEVEAMLSKAAGCGGGRRGR